MRTVLIFANPIAGQGRGRRIADALGRILTQRGFDVRASLDRADRVHASFLKGNFAACISIGGDGTLRSVVHRLIDELTIEKLPPMLVVPLGTANLMTKHLGCDWSGKASEERIADAIAQQRIVMLDAATANGDVFLLMAGVGIDAHIVHELDRLRDGPIDLTSYALPAALALQSYSFTPIEVEIDGQRAFGPKPALAFVGNVKEYGTGFPVLPRARSDDGVLDVCVLPCASRVDLVRLMLLVATGDHVGAEGVLYTTAKRVRITSAEPLPVQVDGEAAGHTPLDVQMLAARIPFIVP